MNVVVLGRRNPSGGFMWRWPLFFVTIGCLGGQPGCVKSQSNGVGAGGGDLEEPNDAAGTCDSQASGCGKLDGTRDVPDDSDRRETCVDVSSFPDTRDLVGDQSVLDGNTGGDLVADMDVALDVKPASVVLSTLAGTPVDAALSGSVAAVALGAGGLGILDLSENQCGSWVGHLALGGACTLVAAHGQTAFALSGDSTLSGVNLQEPSNPVVVSSVLLDGYSAKAILVSKDNLFVLASPLNSSVKLVVLKFDVSGALDLSAQWAKIKMDSAWCVISNAVNPGFVFKMAVSPKGDRLYVCAGELFISSIAGNGDVGSATLYNSESISNHFCVAVAAWDDIVIVSYVVQSSSELLGTGRLELLQPEGQLQAGLNRDPLSMDLALGPDGLLSVEAVLPSIISQPGSIPPLDQSLTRFVVPELLAGQTQPNLTLAIGISDGVPRLKQDGDTVLLSLGDRVDILSFGVPAGLTCTILF